MKDIEDMTPEERTQYVGKLVLDKQELDQTICCLEDKLERLKSSALEVLGDYTWIKSNDPRWEDYPTVEELLKPLKEYETAIANRQKVQERLRVFGVE